MQHGKKLLSLLLAFMLIISLVPAISTSAAAPDDLDRLAVYNAASGNIARSATVTADYSNGTSVATNANNGSLSTGISNTAWNTWGTSLGTRTTPVNIWYTWSQPYTIDAMRVMWWIFTDSGVNWPNSCNVQYLKLGTTDEWVTIGAVGVSGNSGGGSDRPSIPISTWASNTAWNVVRFDEPITTSSLRLQVYGSKTSGNSPGVGMSEWEVFGAEPVLESDEDKVDFDLAWLDFGDTSNVTSKLTLPTTGLNDTTITWSSGGSANLWDDGTVVRPSQGSDATVTLTATVSSGSVSKQKVFTIVIPAYDVSGRAIATVETDFDIDAPVGTCPKLPYRVWVTYTDGYAEWRWTTWPWADATETTWKGYEVGHEYTVQGYITGDNTTSSGYPITANITVVSGTVSVPSEKVADTLPMSKVTITGSNRLSSNNSRAVTAIAGWSPSQYLYNYRDTFGLSTTGYTAFTSGWESATCHLKGHGAGHYLNSMALAYVSGAGTETERSTILSNITRMVNEMREMQEMTFVKEEDGTWLEASETWTYEELSASSVNGSWTNMNANKDPSEFGYGYINAIPPLHPILLEKYTGYNDTSGVWAPYYSIHKQMAGLLDVYYSFKDDPATKDIADKALLICKDMCHWISERLTNRCFIGNDRSTSTYGNLNYIWYQNISGEYGGMNESIARCAALLDDSDPDKALLTAGAEMFDNKSYWDPLTVNSEIMHLSNNSHANQRIPTMPGALWTYSLNNDSRYYTTAKNFFDFVQGRFRYYGGNVGSGEWFRDPYTQIANIGTTINETCCATNLARLAKDLATYEPDNAEYMDAYERVMFNQLVGSLWQTSWSLTYQYSVGPNTTKPSGNSNPGSTCCGGTGAENHVRYTDATYFTSDDTIWVNMYMPTNCVWDVAGVTVKQDCLWPAESSTITVTPNVGETQKSFSMHLRVPWWATKDFDITLNGTSLIELGYTDSFTPSSYVVIPERDWSASDVVEVTCPFTESIDYGPDKYENYWAGTIFYGPLAMTGTGAWSTLNINSDLSNIQLNGSTDYADTSATTPGNNLNVYTASVTGEQSHTNASNLQPDYYRFNSLTHYFKINMLATGGGVDRTALYAKIQDARVFQDGSYTATSFANLQDAIEASVGVYQDSGALQTQVDGQVIAIQAAIDDLVPTAEGKADLLALINEALARKADQEDWNQNPVGSKPWADHGYARMLTQRGAAQTIYDNDEATKTQVDEVYAALKLELDTMRIGSQDEVEDLEELKALLVEAKAKKSILYTLESFDPLPEAIEFGDEVVNHVTQGTSTSSGMIPIAVEQLTAALAGLVDYDGPSPVNLWSGVNYTFYNGTGTYCIEGYGGASGVGGAIDLWGWWSGSTYYVWNLIPDDSNEYFQIKRQPSVNVLAPTGGTVAANTVLTLAAPSTTADNQWWKLILQENGRYIIVNKADPTLCIAPQATPGSGVSIMLAPLTAANNTWRIGNPSSTSAAPAVAVEKPILNVTAQDRITVSAGTPISSITLPSRVSVTFADYTRALRNVTWDTSNYNGDADAVYTLTGTIELGGGIETNPNNIEASIEIVVGNASILLNLVDKCEALNEDDFTEASWAVLEEALANAKSVLYNPDANDQLNKAFNKLTAAYADLESKIDPGAVNKTELAMYIGIAKDILATEGDALRPYGKGVLEGALLIANFVNDSKYATQEMVNDAAFDLLSAIVNLKDIVDRSDLKELIAIIEGIDSSKYAESGWAPLMAALENAQMLGDDSSEAEVTEAYKNLQEAFNGLVLLPVVPKEGLANAMKNTKAILDDIDSFIASTVEGLTALYAEAKTVYDSVNSTLAEVNAMTAKLILANVKARVKEDKTALIKAIGTGQSLKASDYTSASYATLSKALTAAIAVRDDELATRDEITTAATAVNNAIAALKKNDATVISVSGVKLNKTSANLVVGKTLTLSATVSPANAADKTVTWKSSDTKIATVKNGVVTGVKGGKVTITATTRDGAKIAKSTVTVNAYVSMQIGKRTAVNNGNKTTIDSNNAYPFKISGRTMLPIRFVSEKMGGTVKYTSDSAPIVITYGTTKVEIKLGSKTMKVIEGTKSRSVKLDVAAQKRDGRTYLPIRAVSEALGFQVYYEANGQYIVVNNPTMTTAVRNERLAEAKKSIK